eukprot:gb/GEZN01014846.1/.p1 GENE.gb/GEZN01014846.1/~~gb/GEZN01014846.1/.p1  ORF type:complete len:282 (-),score=35.35 gb/GEZN01014846.1/:58-903(-)
MRLILLVQVVLFLSSMVVITSAQPFPPKKPKKVYGVNKLDLKYTQCAACQELVKQLVRKVGQLSAEQAESGKKLSEDSVFALLDDICRPITEPGSWLKKMDITVGADGEVVLEEYPKAGHCMTECVTLADTCNKVIEASSIELGEELWKGTKRAKLEDMACRRWTKTCRNKKKQIVPVGDRGKVGAEKFEAMSETDALMDHMEAAGLGGSIHRAQDFRDMMAAENGEGGGMDEDGGILEDEEEKNEVPKVTEIIDSAVEAGVNAMSWIGEKADKVKNWMMK